MVNEMYLIHNTIVLYHTMMLLHLYSEPLNHLHRFATIKTVCNNILQLVVMLLAIPLNVVYV